MKVIMNGNVRDCSAEMGETLIAAGLAREITPRDEANAAMSVHPPHFVNWHAIDSGSFVPALVYRCSTCAKMEYQYPRDGKVKFRVPCGLTKNEKGVYVCDWHECPREVVQAYVRLFDRWKNGKTEDISNPEYQERLDSMIRRDPRLAYLKAGAAVTL